jgi:hypothetical protein
MGHPAAAVGTGERAASGLALAPRAAKRQPIHPETTAGAAAGMETTAGAAVGMETTAGVAAGMETTAGVAVGASATPPDSHRLRTETRGAAVGALATPLDNHRLVMAAAGASATPLDNHRLRTGRHRHRMVLLLLRRPTVRAAVRETGLPGVETVETAGGVATATMARIRAAPATTKLPPHLRMLDTHTLTHAYLINTTMHSHTHSFIPSLHNQRSLTHMSVHPTLYGA